MAHGGGRHHHTSPSPAGPVEHRPHQPQAGALAGEPSDHRARGRPLIKCSWHMRQVTRADTWTAEATFPAPPRKPNPPSRSRGWQRQVLDFTILDRVTDL